MMRQDQDEQQNNQNQTPSVSEAKTNLPCSRRVGFAVLGLFAVAGAAASGYGFYYPGRQRSWYESGRTDYDSQAGDGIGMVITYLSPVGFAVCALLLCLAICRRQEHQTANDAPIPADEDPLHGNRLGRERWS